MNLAADLDEFLSLHRTHGAFTPKVGALTPNGYRLELACSCGVTFERWVTTQAEAQFLYIISRERPDLYHRFSTEFADLPQVTVILERRVGGGTPIHERRVRTIDDDFETLGCATVPL